MAQSAPQQIDQEGVKVLEEKGFTRTEGLLLKRNELDAEEYSLYFPYELRDSLVKSFKETVNQNYTGLFDASYEGEYFRFLRAGDKIKEGCEERTPADVLVVNYDFAFELIKGIIPQFVSFEPAEDELKAKNLEISIRRELENLSEPLANIKLAYDMLENRSKGGTAIYRETDAKDFDAVVLELRKTPKLSNPQFFDKKFCISSENSKRIILATDFEASTSLMCAVIIVVGDLVGQSLYEPEEYKRVLASRYGQHNHTSLIFSKSASQNSCGGYQSVIIVPSWLEKHVPSIIQRFEEFAQITLTPGENYKTNLWASPLSGHFETAVVMIAHLCSTQWNRAKDAALGTDRYIEMSGIEWRNLETAAENSDLSSVVAVDTNSSFVSNQPCG